MANNVLDMLGRAVLRIGGMSPQQIRQQSRANRASKPMPKPRGSKPAATPPKPKPPAIQPKGQTNLFTQNGNPRNFRNPATSASRPPTLSPVPQRGGQATPPRPPAGGFGAPTAPGQGFFDLGAGQRQGISNPWGPPTSPTRAIVQRTATSRTAPSVPSAGAGIRQYSQDAKDWVAQNSSGARINRATNANAWGLRGLNVPSRLGLELMSIPTGVTSAAANLAISNFGLSGEDPDRRARLLGFKDAADQQRRIAAQQAKESGTSNGTTSRFSGSRDENLARINNDPRFAAPAAQPARPAATSSRPSTPAAPAPVQPQAAPAAPRAPRSPASSAPVHAAPAQLRAPAEQALAPAPVQPSVYAPQVGQAPRPSTPAQAVQQQPQAPANPYAGIGDVRGQQLPQSPVQQDAELSAGSQQYGGQSVQGIDENGVDMERRRAFLDADNSLDGMKAVRELLRRRKLSISVSD